LQGVFEHGDAGAVIAARRHRIDLGEQFGVADLVERGLAEVGL